MAETISFTLNGKSVSVTTDGGRPLLWVLRTDLGLTGPKFGCGQALCGACTVLIDDKAVRSCVYPARNAEGRKVTTIEGLAEAESDDPTKKRSEAAEALRRVRKLERIPRYDRVNDWRTAAPAVVPHDE